MLEIFDHILLSRIQFAFTVSVHIIFPALTIGLASWLAVLEGLWLKTKHPIYMEVYQFWVKIFAVNFGMGVVSGLVMAYQFGTNWSNFSDHVGNVIGPLLGYEVLTAFFLEASFLGIMLFGREKVGPKMHFAATLTVAIGTLISAFWILSANSWMQTPQGYSIMANGTLQPTDWLAIIFNPSFPYRFFHMTLAAFLSTAFVVAGVGGWYLLKNRYTSHAKIMFAKALLAIAILAPLQLLVGDLHGLNTLEYQPQKVAAMEGIWETEKGAGLVLFGVPNPETETTDHALKIPKLASLILTHDAEGEVKGLKHWPKEDRPPVPVVFYSFHLMVGIGMLMILTGFLAVALQFTQHLYTSRLFQRWCVLMAPMGFVALLAGWFVTEVGRQPYIVFGVLRTLNMASPLTSPEVAWSLLMFVVVYFSVFGAGVYYIFRLISKGVRIGDWHNLYGQHHLREPVTLIDAFRLNKPEGK
jgi:cytochrome d ubiquinol oxidase subunit I